MFCLGEEGEINQMRANWEVGKKGLHYLSYGRGSTQPRRFDLGLFNLGQTRQVVGRGGGR